jgi:hypothetical protein
VICLRRWLDLSCWEGPLQAQAKARVQAGISPRGIDPQRVNAQGVVDVEKAGQFVKRNRFEFHRLLWKTRSASKPFHCDREKNRLYAGL